MDLKKITQSLIINTMKEVKENILNYIDNKTLELLNTIENIDENVIRKINKNIFDNDNEEKTENIINQIEEEAIQTNNQPENIIKETKIETPKHINKKIENNENDHNITNLFNVNEDILKTNCQYIIHQTNTTGLRSSGLSAKIFKQFPNANIYKKEIKRSPGTIIVKDNIINLFGQIKPGKPNKDDDTLQIRIKWFNSGLNMIGNLKDIKSVAIPYKIGCGLAGGKWEDYESMIYKFAKENPNIKVKIYKKNI
jgi:O-acetyl-ADP-ribose deacetylase (regulator of RNase III)